MKFIGWKWKFIIFWLNFTKILTLKKWKKKLWNASICIKNYCFKWISIDYVPLFDIYELSYEHFVFWRGDMIFPTCQNIGNKIVWGYEMIGFHHKFNLRQIKKRKLCEVCSFLGLYILHMNVMCGKHVWHVNKCVYEWGTNLWMKKCCTNFASSYKSMCQMCFQCTILIHETYELWMNKFCTISLTKSWDVKFVMCANIYTLNMCTRRITILMQVDQNLWNFNHVQWKAQYYSNC
jgi:hypothetical protein